jgi:predicted phosphoribosyltransferase
VTDVYRDRREAGSRLARILAGQLGDDADRGDPVVLGLPRGGVPVAAEVAAALQAPLDVFVVRKLGVPGQPELAMGAIASGGVVVRNPAVTAELGISEAAFAAVREREAAELARREAAYRGVRPPVPLRGRTVVLVDDGIATGASMRAAIAALRELGPARVVVGVPVAAVSTCVDLAREVDELVCPLTPPGFGAVGAHYLDFRATTDEEVRRALEAAS